MSDSKFYCLEHRPPPDKIPWGYALTVDLEYHKCALCEQQSRVELAQKALSYPSLGGY